MGVLFELERHYVMPEAFLHCLVLLLLLDQVIDFRVRVNHLIHFAVYVFVQIKGILFHELNMNLFDILVAFLALPDVRRNVPFVVVSGPLTFLLV